MAKSGAAVSIVPGRWRASDVELVPDRLIGVRAEEEAAVVGAILTDRRFHVEVPGHEAERDRAAVERYGL